MLNLKAILKRFIRPLTRHPSTQILQAVVGLDQQNRLREKKKTGNRISRNRKYGAFLLYSFFVVLKKTIAVKIINVKISFYLTNCSQIYFSSYFKQIPFFKILCTCVKKHFKPLKLYKQKWKQYDKAIYQYNIRIPI